MAIWRYLIRPALPWLARLAAAVVASLLVAWICGTLFIRRAEPDRGDGPPPGVAGRMATVGGRPVYVLDVGSGDPVVLVHDFGGSTFDVARAVVALAQSHRVVAFDLLGHGYSARANDLEYGWDLWTRQTLDVMDALDVPRASLVGFGLGAAIAALVAGEHPDRVAKLVLVSPRVPLEQSERPWSELLLEIPGVGEMLLGTHDRLPDGYGFPPPADVERTRAIFRREGTRRALLTYVRHGRDRERLAVAYREIATPTLVVAGTEDHVVPYAAVRKWTPSIADALLLPIGNAGHALLYDEPERVVGAIEDFLSRAPATAPAGGRRE